jgi:hypothetical protein
MTNLNHFSKLINDFEPVTNIWANAFKPTSKFPSTTDSNFEYSQETVETESSVTVTETWKSTNGSVNFSRTVTSPREVKVNEDEIRAQIKKAVKEEDYETAATLKRKLSSK